MKIADFRTLIGKKVWRMLWISAFAGIAWFAIETSFIFVLQAFLAALKIAPEKYLFLPNWFPRSPVAMGLMFLLYGLLRAVVTATRQFLSIKVSQTFLMEQKSYIIKYGLENAALESSQRIITLFNEVVGKASSVVSSLVVLAQSIVSGTLFLVLCLRLAPIETGLGLVGLGFFALSLRPLAGKIGSLGKLVNQEMGEANRVFLEGFRNHFLLRLYSMLDSTIKQGVGSLQRYERLHHEFAFWASVKTAAPLFMGTFVLGAVVTISMNFLPTEPMKLVAFLYLFVRLGQVSSEVNHTLANSRFHLPSLEALMDLSAKMRKSSQVMSTPTAPPLVHVELELRNISFAYPSTQNPVLQDFSLKISRGETLLIKGPSGVGKSTLLALLTGMLKPDHGDILLNGTSTENLLGALSSSIGYVGPEPYMVSGSVRDNLLYGLTPERKARVGEEKLAWAMKLANVSDFVAAMPEGLATQLREHTQLSSGQKQRLAICRALLRDPQLMVFDEATANLDFETERGLIEELARLRGGYTMIVVSHKESFDGMADKIVHILSPNVLRVEKGSDSRRALWS